MAMLGKRRPPRAPSGVSGLQRRDAPRRGSGGDDATVSIERLAHDGRGVAHDAGGKTLFVEGALPGERVEVAIHRTRQRFDEGHVRSVVEASPERATPPCRHYARCGGCDLQHLALPEQRRHKVDTLVDLLARQGVEVPGEPERLTAAGEGYRRRARLGVKVDARGDVHLGFRARHSQRLVDVRHCTILVPPLAALLPPLHALVAGLEGPRHLGHIELLAADQGPVLVVRQLRDNPSDGRRWRDFASLHGVHLAQRLGREAPSLRWLTPEPRLSVSVPSAAGELELAFAPGDFLQANADVNRLMIDTARRWLGDLDGRRVLDLYAGVGNFSLPLAAGGARLTAVEGNPAMVARLADNARANSQGQGLALVARQADLGRCEALPGLLDDVDPAVVLLDPPREGAEAACRALAARPVPRVLYVSCDPATLARDAAHLVHAGYRPSRLAMADMFVHTSHLESMLLFEHP
jgi:23S rRNA (uracil1939-C5)-methyltransferase